MSAKFRLEETEVAGSGHNFIGIAGEALTNRELVRVNAAGTLVAADASATATLPAIGITLAAATTGQSVLVLLKGWVGLSTWTWTAGGRLYVSDTAGALTQTAGTVTQEVGVAYSTTQIWFDPHGIDTTGGAGRGVDDVFIPVPDPDAFVGDHAAARLTDGQDTLVRMSFFLPLEFDISTWSVDVLIVAGGTGNLRRGVDTDFGLITEAYNANTDTIAAGVVAVTINLITAIDITEALTGSTALDMVGMEFTRSASNAADTVNADCYMLGVLIRRP